MRKWIFIFIAIVFLYFLSVAFWLFPIVIERSSDHQLVTEIATHQKGDTINPLLNFDFDKGDWSAYLILVQSDRIDLSDEMPSGKCFKTSDIDLLKRMQTGLKFIYTGGDMATVESYIALYKNGKQVFKTGIVLDKFLEGFQSQQYGWLAVCSEQDLVYFCKEFRKIYSPVLILP